MQNAAVKSDSGNKYANKSFQQNFNLSSCAEIWCIYLHRRLQLEGHFIPLTSSGGIVPITRTRGFQSRLRPSQLGLAHRPDAPRNKNMRLCEEMSKRVKESADHSSSSFSEVITVCCSLCKVKVKVNVYLYSASS